MCRFVVLLFVVVCFQQILHTVSQIRQKRCIVIQKQSGTHGDSTEGADERIEDPQERPEGPHNKRPGNRHDLQDTEELSPELLRYKFGKSKKMNELNRLKKKFKANKRI
ncbi:uncharacterized protein LOC124541482 [Vanessa cardui]|uniref:uncharacterized protein LOC124541482 n=1 Tax=Vanessa cardui TaxID=171605 RepID=UPI001F13B881|nr:uncharacterized protein LOC124541482 [Vanessa cardui]